MEFICFRPEKPNFFVKNNNQLPTQNHEQGTHSSKMGTVVWPKIPKMRAPTFLGPEVWDFQKKISLLVSVHGFVKKFSNYSYFLFLVK